MYFFFHAITGENGFRSYLVIKKKVDEQTKILDNLKKERDSLERRVKLLSNDSLDRDILEERCRIVLNLAMPDDIIIKENTIQ